MVRFYHTGPEPLSDHGAPDGADLQLVDDLHAIGDSGSARRSHHVASAGAAWHRQTNQARQSNHRGDHQHAFERIDHSGSADEGKRLFQEYQGDCGAVDPTGAMAVDSQHRFQGIPRRQNDRQYCPGGSRYRLTAVFRIISEMPGRQRATATGLPKTCPTTSRT
jgi:hypothetical protein